MQQESLEAELAAMEDEALTERLIGADHVPVHVPEGASELSSSSLRVYCVLMALRTKTRCRGPGRRRGSSTPTTTSRARDVRPLPSCFYLMYRLGFPAPFHSYPAYLFHCSNTQCTIHNVWGQFDLRAR
jgi:hypothetical protein